jgi:hypothetical protein
MNKLPDKLFYVRLLPGGKPLGFRKNGSKLYTDSRAAFSHYQRLKHDGQNAEILEVHCDWQPLESSSQGIDGQQELWNDSDAG